MMHSCSVSDISPSSVQGKSAIADRQYGRHSAARPRNDGTNVHVICSYIAKGFALGRV